MLTSVRAYVLFAVFQAISSEVDNDRGVVVDPSIPKNCYGPPDDINLYECCPLEPLFDALEMELCGFKKSADPAVFEDCLSRICIFKKYNLLNDDETINYEAVSSLLDKWAENQTHVVEAVAKAKEICFGKKDGPPVPQWPFADIRLTKCDIDKLLVCFRSITIWNCKHRVHIPPCKVLSDHMAECKQYLYKAIPTD